MSNCTFDQLLVKYLTQGNVRQHISCRVCAECCSVLTQFLVFRLAPYIISSLIILNLFILTASCIGVSPSFSVGGKQIFSLMENNYTLIKSLTDLMM